MAILKTKDMREMNDKELAEKIRELRLEFTREKAMSEVGASVKNPGRIGEIRRTIARAKTIAREKEGGKK